MDSKNAISFFMFLFTSLLLPDGLAAQDYKTIKSSTSDFFCETEGTEIIGIRIDSVKTVGTDIYYYNFKQFQPWNNGCWIADGHSWLGDEVVEKKDGSFQFKILPFPPGGSEEIFNILTR